MFPLVLRTPTKQRRKTQIALEYAYRRSDDKACSVFWVHADNEATFIHDYKLIGKKLGVAGTLDGDDLLVAICDRIEAQERWVLILDNADDLSLFGVGTVAGQLKSLFDFVPRGGVGTVLWTSRDERIVGTLVSPVRGIQVSSMSPNEARELLAAARNDLTEDPETNILLEELQCLPLAISQAGAYMRRTATPVPKYLALLAQGKQRWSILKETEFDRHRKPNVSNSILETWSILIDRIQKESEMAYRILHVIAYVDNQDIPHEVVAAASGSDKEGAAESEHLRVIRAITRLKEFSFVSMRSTEDGSRSYEMHKLVQEAVRYGLSVRESLREREGNHGENSPDQDDEAFFSGVALEIITGLFPESEPQTWAKCEKYLRHAVLMGEWAEIWGKEIKTAELLERVSRFLYQRGRWREKEPVDMMATKLRREILGENHLATIASTINLAATYNGQGRYNEAEKIIAKAVALQREALGEKHPYTIRCTAALAVIYREQGRYSEAERIEASVLALRRESLGKKHPDTVSSMDALARACYRYGRYSEAEQMQTEVVTLQKEILGEEHQETLRSMVYLAAVYDAQGRHDQAEGINVEVLRLRREVLGEKHPDTLASMNALAMTYFRQARYCEAEEILTEVLALRREVIGENHPRTLRTMHNLAVAWREDGRCEDALSLMESSVRQRRSVLGQSHPETEFSTRILEQWSTDQTVEQGNTN